MLKTRWELFKIDQILGAMEFHKQFLLIITKLKVQDILILVNSKKIKSLKKTLIQIIQLQFGIMAY